MGRMLHNTTIADQDQVDHPGHQTTDHIPPPACKVRSRSPPQTRHRNSLKEICTKPEDGHTQGPKHVVNI